MGEVTDRLRAAEAEAARASSRAPRFGGKAPKDRDGAEVLEALSPDRSAGRHERAERRHREAAKLYWEAEDKRGWQRHTAAAEEHAREAKAWREPRREPGGEYPPEVKRSEQQYGRFPSLAQAQDEGRTTRQEHGDLSAAQDRERT